MKRTEPLRIDEVIRRMIDATGMRSDYTRHSAESAWPAIVGPHIAAYTGRLYVKDRVMHVYITSAPLREELGYARRELVDKINRAVGTDAIDDILLH